jgi:hypothetical protein
MFRNRITVGPTLCFVCQPASLSRLFQDDPRYESRGQEFGALFYRRGSTGLTQVRGAAVLNQRSARSE